MSNESKLFKGRYYQIEESYNRFLRDNDVEIVSTALSKDFEEHGNSEQFIFIVTFKRKAR